MLLIPLAKVPAQSLSVLLAGQSTQISVRYTLQGVFCDVSLEDVPVVQGVIAYDRTLLVRSPTTNFLGDLFFSDLQGRSDPDWREFGVRFHLAYLSADELVTYQLTFGAGG